jgi:uncharacterized protein (DUF1778 family)
MNLNNSQHSSTETNQPLMTDTVSVRLTHDERAAFERFAAVEERTLSNYIRKQLRTHLERKKGTER